VARFLHPGPREKVDSETCVCGTEGRQKRLQPSPPGEPAAGPHPGVREVFGTVEGVSLKSCLRKAVIWGILYLKD